MIDTATTRPEREFASIALGMDHRGMYSRDSPLHALSAEGPLRATHRDAAEKLTVFPHLDGP